MPDGRTTAFLLFSGEVVVEGERGAGEGDLAFFSRRGRGIAVKAKQEAKLLLISGDPIAEPVVGPEVAFTRVEFVP